MKDWLTHTFALLLVAASAVAGSAEVRAQDEVPEAPAEGDEREVSPDAPGEHPPVEAVPPQLLPGPAPPAAPGARGARVQLLLQVEVDGHVGEVEVRAVELEPGPEDDALRTTVTDIARAYAEGLTFEPARVRGEAVVARVGFEVVLAPAAQADSDASGGDATDEQSGGNTEAEGDTETEGDTDSEGAEGDSAEGDTAEGEGTDDDTPNQRAFGARGQADAPVDERPAVAASDFDVDIGQLRQVPRTGAQSMLTLVPGVLLTQHASEGHALSMFLRGFDAAEGEDLEVLVDGMPINEVSNAHGHGYVDTLLAIPQVVRSLRVVQGPFDPSQGDFATAGTASYRLGVEEPGLHLSLGYGRFDELRFAGWWRPRSASPGTFAAITYNQGDGFGVNRSFRNGSAMGRYEGGDRRLHFSVMAFAATGTWQTAGVLRADDVALRRVPGCGDGRDAQFFCTYDPNQGGSTSQGGVVSRVQHRRPNELFELTAFGRLRSLRVAENFTGFATDPRTDGGPQRGDNLDQRYDATMLGLRGRYRVSRPWLGFAQRFEAGVQLRYDDADTRADRRRRARSVPYRTEFDRRVRETLVGAYLRTDLRLADWFSFVGGVRLDFFGFNVDDFNFAEEDEVGERLGRGSFSASGVAASPRGTLRFTLLDDFDLVVAAGLGARSSDAAALSEAELAPFARVTALETGLVYDREPSRPGAREWFGEARASAFTTRVSQDLVFDPTAGRNSVLGPSIRSGVLGQGRIRYGRYFDLLASVTYTRSHLQPDGSNVLALFDGPRLPFIPGWVARLDAAGNVPVTIQRDVLKLSAALGVQVVGQRPLPLGEVADPFALVDVALGARWRMVEVGAALQNLFDARYRSAELNYVSNFRDPELPPSMMAARHYSAGAPRTFMLTLTLHLDFAPAPTTTPATPLPAR